MNDDSWCLGEYLSVDTETTGTDCERDRVVTASVVLVDGTGRAAPKVQSWLAWPGIDIPAGAQKVHGITTEHAREMGLPACQVIGEVCEVIVQAVRDGLPLVLFNAPFDLTLLDRECRRHELGPLAEDLDAGGGLVVDPMVIDKAVDFRKGKRTLTDLAAYYGVKQDEAHSAAGDAITAARVAWKITAKHRRVAEMTLPDLHEWQIDRKLQQARSFAEYLRRQGKDDEAAKIDGWWPLRPFGEGVRQ